MIHILEKIKRTSRLCAHTKKMLQIYTIVISNELTFSQRYWQILCIQSILRDLMTPTRISNIQIHF